MQCMARNSRDLASVFSSDTLAPSQGSFPWQEIVLPDYCIRAIRFSLTSLRAIPDRNGERVITLRVPVTIRFFLSTVAPDLGRDPS